MNAHLRAAYLFSLLLILAHSGAERAFSQQIVTSLVEPTRFAFLVGNGKGYGGQMLPKLGSPCHDVDRMEAALKASGITDITKACDIKKRDLAGMLDAYMDKVLSTDRALGIFYFSGHGAHINGRNYIFGVDADIDTEAVVKKFTNNRSSPLFLNEAIDLSDLSKIAPLYGRAAFVIIDACRSNPVIEAFQKQRFRETVAYPAKANELPGILVGFASSRGEAAASGGFNSGQYSPYTRILAETIEQHRDKDISLDTILNKAATSMRVLTDHKQIPDRAGQVVDPPTFCLHGCASHLDDFKSYDEQFFQRTPAPSPPPPTSASPPEQKRGFNGASTVSRQASLSTAPAAPVPKGAVAEVRVAESTEQDTVIRADVIWCEGKDSASLGSLRSAQEATRQLSQLQNISVSWKPIPGSDLMQTKLIKIGGIKIKALPQTANINQIFRENRNVVYYPPELEQEKAVAQRIGALLDLPAVPDPRRAAADYLSIYYCDNSVARATVSRNSRVYFQVANAGQLEPARLVRKAMLVNIPGIDVVSGIENVGSRAPEQTEVRYFYDREEAAAKQISKYLQRFVAGSVPTKKVAGYESTLKDQPLLEVWFGSKAVIDLPTAESASGVSGSVDK